MGGREDVEGRRLQQGPGMVRQVRKVIGLKLGFGRRLGDGTGACGLVGKNLKAFGTGSGEIGGGRRCWFLWVVVLGRSGVKLKKEWKRRLAVEEDAAVFNMLRLGFLEELKLRLQNSMLGNGCLPNVVAYTALIDGLCKAGEVEKACQIYAKMRGTCDVIDVDKYFEGGDANITKPNVFTYGALVDGLCKAHKVVEASDLLEAMSSAGCEPNHIVHDALIDGFCKVGKLDDAQEIFVKMSKSRRTPSVYTYSSLLDRLFKDGDLDRAKKILSAMLENSCFPNVITYTEMIDGLCKLGKTEEAYKLLAMMEEKGCKPNVVTFTAMIDGYGRAGNLDMCLEIFRQMISKGCSPNFITYRVLINHCCRSGLLDEAYELLEEMKQTYWPRHVAGYRNIVQGVSRKFLISLGLLEEITEYSSMPIAPAYKILIDSFYKAGSLDRALELHKEITSIPSCLPVISKNIYSSLIESLCLASKVEKGFELYSEMIGKGHVPEISLLFFLVNGLLKVNKWDEALQISYIIHHMGIHWVVKDSVDRS